MFLSEGKWIVMGIIMYHWGRGGNAIKRAFQNCPNISVVCICVSVHVCVQAVEIQAVCLMA